MPLFFCWKKNPGTEFDVQVAGTAFNKAAKHRWYLQQKTVICYLFSKHQKKKQ